MLRKMIGLLLVVGLLWTQVGSAAAQGGPTGRRISFAPGAITATRTGVLTMGGMVRYVLGINAGQTLNVSAASANNNVILIIFGADGTVLLSDHVDASSWSGVVPSTQDYYVDVRAIDGTSANYTLTVTIPPEPPLPPHPASNASALPRAQSRRPSRAGDAGRQQRVCDQGQCQPGDVDQHQPEEQAIAISVAGADGTVLQSSMGGSSNFSGEAAVDPGLAITVTIQGDGFADYQMTVTIEPLVD